MCMYVCMYVSKSTLIETCCKHYFSLLWSPAAPKLSLYPATIQSHLFPKYHSPREAQRQREEQEEVTFKEQPKLGGRYVRM